VSLIPEAGGEGVSVFPDPKLWASYAAKALAAFVVPWVVWGATKIGLPLDVKAAEAFVTSAVGALIVFLWKNGPKPS